LSLWRRAHQAVAKRSHAATREAKPDPLQERVPDLASPAPAITTTKFFSTPIVTRLTDEKWECVRSLMPSQNPSTGRPRRDHHQVLAEMVWVLWHRIFVPSRISLAASYLRTRAHCKDSGARLLGEVRTIESAENYRIAGMKHIFNRRFSLL
jgi:hypothetical protein